MFSWLPIRSDADLTALSSELKASDFGLGDVIDWLRLYLSSNVAGMLIEYPYVDKDYRSTFYHYYAKKGGNYSPYCARLHFFSKGLDWRESPQSLVVLGQAGPVSDAVLNEYYLGFIVLRPTRIYTIGRTMLSPNALKDASGLLIQHRHKAHVLGHRLHVECFPFMEQHSDIAVSIWPFVHLLDSNLSRNPVRMHTHFDIMFGRRRRLLAARQTATCETTLATGELLIARS